MATNNHIILTGRLGADPKLLQNQDKCFVAFSLATQDRYQDKENNWKNKDTQWHRCMAFSTGLVDLAQKLKKGMRIKVTGSLSYRSFNALVEEGKTVPKQEATILAEQIEHCPLLTSPQAQ